MCIAILFTYMSVYYVHAHGRQKKMLDLLGLELQLLNTMWLLVVKHRRSSRRATRALNC